MKKLTVRFGAVIVCAVLALFWVGESEAASVKLRYGFKAGATYRVTEQNHDVGKSVTEMNIMGQQQKIETPSDRVSSGVWTAKVTGKEGGGVKLAVEYGQYKGGQRWAGNKTEIGDVFADSTNDAPTIGGQTQNDADRAKQ
jgi:hypothetical protein